MDMEKLHDMGKMGEGKTPSVKLTVKRGDVMDVKCTCKGQPHDKYCPWTAPAKDNSEHEKFTVSKTPLYDPKDTEIAELKEKVKELEGMLNERNLTKPR